MRETRSDLTTVLPHTIDGWSVAAQDHVYTRENLYDYIDGGAELYLSFGFTSLLSRTYSEPSQPDIVVDIFDMGASQNAFGVFSQSREAVDTTFGQESQYIPGLLLFWKNNYFVSILASPETVESKKAMFSLAETIEAAIAEEGPLPEILTFLPQEALVRESIRYFRHYVFLNSYYFVADENILHIDEKTDAVLARYGQRDKQYLLLLVKYQDDGEARRGYHDFVKYYLPERSGKTVVQLEDDTWTGCQLRGNLLIIVFDAPTEDEAVHLMKAVQR